MRRFTHFNLAFWAVFSAIDLPLILLTDTWPHRLAWNVATVVLAVVLSFNIVRLASKLRRPHA